jgi:hypothetical protein
MVVSPQGEDRWEYAFEANPHLGVAKGGSCGPGRPSALQ